MRACLVVMLVACGSAREDAAGGGAPSGVPSQVSVERAAPGAPDTAQGSLTRNRRYLLSWVPAPSPIPTSELFEVRVSLRDATSGAPVTDGTVRVDARMPQHGHGMATRPVDDPGVCTGSGDAMTCTHPEGIYVTRGMKFHMPGEWTLSFAVDGPAGPDQLELRTTL